MADSILSPPAVRVGTDVRRAVMRQVPVPDESVAP